MVRFCSCSVLLVLSLLASSCKREPSPPVPSVPVKTSRREFQVKGVVLAVNLKGKEVEVRHEEIPGYMEAMTMPFPVKDTNELAGLEPGTRVSFRLIDAGKEGWIDQIRKLATPSTNGVTTSLEATSGSAATTVVRPARDVEPLNVGDALPDYHFTNQFGKAFSTSDFKGQALAITFLFTRCPFPNFCPRMANNFAEAQQKLLAQTNAPGNWRLLTVSFDPEFDKPEVLKTYAQAHQCDPAHWTFATGDLADITAIGEQFGLQFWHDSSGSISHNLRTIVVDPAGKVQRVFEGNNWTSDELAGEMVRAAKGGTGPH
jgi:protein SCO1/2